MKVKGRRSKKVESPKGLELKNMFSILDRIDDDNNIVRNKEDGAS